MNVSPLLVRSRIAGIRRNVTSLEEDVTRFSRLTSRAPRSSGHFNLRYLAALREEVQTLRAICAVYRAILTYFENTCNSIEAQDVALGQSINRLTQPKS